MCDNDGVRTNRRPYGAVTFLDVLGWKGIWGREADAIGSLQTLTLSIEKRARELGRGRGQAGLHTRVLGISDSIVLITNAPGDEAIDALVLHGELCASALPDSIAKGIPIRGASSYGHFEVSGNGSIFLGSAIDEAASWHEHADWIGVFMTPSARFVFGEEEIDPWCMYKPPYKSNLKFDTFAVKWDFDPGNGDAVGKKFIRMGPIFPELIPKFTNTLSFLKNACVCDEED